MRNPYRRALLLASLDEIKTTDFHLLKILGEYLPNHITKVVDAVGTANLNVHLKNPIKHIIPPQPDRFEEIENEENSENVIRVPRPDGTIDEIELF